MTIGYIAGAILFAAVAFIGYEIWRALREPIIPAAHWTKPPIGSRWEHCGRVLTVVDHSWIDEDWSMHSGVSCDYMNDDGHLERVLFTPAQWEAVVVGNRMRAP